MEMTGDTTPFTREGILDISGGVPTVSFSNSVLLAEADQIQVQHLIISGYHRMDPINYPVVLRFGGGDSA